MYFLSFSSSLSSFISGFSCCLHHATQCCKERDDDDVEVSIEQQLLGMGYGGGQRRSMKELVPFIFLRRCPFFSSFIWFERVFLFASHSTFWICDFLTIPKDRRVTEQILGFARQLASIIKHNSWKRFLRYLRRYILLLFCNIFPSLFLFRPFRHFNCVLLKFFALSSTFTNAVGCCSGVRRCEKEEEAEWRRITHSSSLHLLTRCLDSATKMTTTKQKKVYIFCPSSFLFHSACVMI